MILDIWVAQRITRDADWERPTNHGAGSNTAFAEVGLAASRDEHWLYISPNSRREAQPFLNIYAAFRSEHSQLERSKHKCTRSPCTTLHT
jgi:hypothetical protein